MDMKTGAEESKEFVPIYTIDSDGGKIEPKLFYCSTPECKVSTIYFYYYKYNQLN